MSLLVDCPADGGVVFEKDAIFGGGQERHSSAQGEIATDRRVDSRKSGH
jgi:hypothetical protein